MEDFLAAAAQFINTTSSHIFLTGKAGTGKTTFLKNLPEVTHKNFIVVAPTGIAALNAGGVTIHSQFLLPPATFLPDRSLPEDFSENGRFINQNTLARKHPLNSARKQVLRSIDLLVIDEVSMLRADLLDAIDYRMRAAKGNFRQSFGGVQVLFIGDLYQLPPVVRNDEKEKMSQYYHSAWFYEAKAFQDNQLVYIELDKIFRQHDPIFINILNNLRNNVATPDDIEALNQYYKSPDEISQLREVITLTTHNSKADEINQRELSKLHGQSHTFRAYIEGDFPDNMYPVLPKIELKEGAQVMFTRNDNEEKKYFNGKLATVKEISGDEVWVELAETREPYLLKQERWENKKYTLNKTTNDLEDEVIGAFEQFPIKLAWAITVHKSQGLTFDRAIIDVGQAFADGQVYVALSRLRSLQGLTLRTHINPSAISTDRLVIEFVKANHMPDQLSGLMRQRQQDFIQHLIDQTFDFSGLVKEIQYILKDSTEANEFKEDSMKPVLLQIAESLEGEQSITEKFRGQLMSLLSANDQIKLLDRIGKGSDYYKNILVQNIEKLLRHLEEMKQHKRVKTYVNQLGDIDQSFTKKLEEVDKASLLVSAILNGDERFNFEPLNKLRAEAREQLLLEIRNEPPHRSSLPKKKKSPKGRKTKSKEGPTTYEITLQMLSNGTPVEQIAKERELTMGTIEGHLAKAVETGSISVYKFMDDQSVTEIANAISHLPKEFTSKDLYAALKGKFGYGQLKAVMAHVKQSSM
jgi:hypothetical protein